MQFTETLTASNEMEIRFMNGAIVRMQALHEAERTSTAAHFFFAGATALADYMNTAADIAKDDNLSAAGRTRKLEPLVIAAVRTVSACFAEVNLFAAHLESRYAALVAVPELAAGNIAAALEDFEIRQWWRDLPASERGSVLRAMQSGPQYQRVEIALLRSPVLVADHELQMVRSAWDKAKCDECPSDAVDINAGRATVGWARRGLMQLAGALVASLDASVWPRRRIVREVLAGNERQAAGFGVFGFSDADAAELKRQLAKVPVFASER